MSFLEQGSNQEPQTPVEDNQQVAQQPAGAEEQVFLKVGDRTFKSQEDAVRHVSSAQDYIQKLESDFESATALLDRQQQLLDKSKNVDDVMKAIAQRDSSGNAEDTPQLSKDEVIADALRAFEQQQEMRTAAQQKAENARLVHSTLSQSYGDKMDEVVQKVAVDNGLSMQEAEEMATRHPKVFLKMFDTGSRHTAKPTQGGVNTQAVYTPQEQPYRPLKRMSMKERAAEVQRRLQETN